METAEPVILKPIPPRPEFAGILREDVRFADAERDDLANVLNGWFDRLMLQSGLELSPAVLTLLCALGAVVVGGGAFVVREDLLLTALAALIGFALPVVSAVVIRYRRVSTMMRQLPAALDELARAARTGRSLERCFERVAYDTPQPLGGELQLCAARMQMGVSVPEALTDLPARTGLSTLNVLVTALSVHQQMGGDLVRVLERLAHTLRDRLLFLGRLRAATIASRATAALMIILPPCILAFFTFRDPEYFQNLMSSTWGKAATLTAVGLQILGTVWVLRILNRSMRG